jgi:hypothetical protein
MSISITEVPMPQTDPAVFARQYAAQAVMVAEKLSAAGNPDRPR